MKKFFKKFMTDERGDVVQYIIVLAVVAIILAFAFPAIRDKIATQTETSLGQMDKAFDAGNASGTATSTPAP
jgi:Flp pilus assembly pilin Flp